VAWEKRRNRLYLYRSVRQGIKVRKVYLGAGPRAQEAVESDRKRQAEQALLRESEAVELLRVEAVMGQALRLESIVRLLAEAVLMAIGLRRQNRRPWRPWREGRKAISVAGGAGRQA
jgi:hypothetical protein